MEFDKKLTSLKDEYASNLADKEEKTSETFKVEVNLLKEQKQKLIDENRRLQN